jgi:ATP synthase protein I
MDDDEKTFAKRVAEKADRKLKAQRDGSRSVWFGLGMLGTVGWSVTLPTLLGCLVGHWLDRRHPGAHSWTLALLVAGVVIGCANAWYWVSRENQSMHDEQDNK